MSLTGKQKAWSLDQLTKSTFFHQKLHEWGLLDVTDEIEKIKGETLEWEQTKLNISKDAWDKVIHRGIKPVIVFAHPYILRNIPRSVGYYRMLSMVSQKSMNQIGLSSTRFEQTNIFPNESVAWAIAQRLNNLISNLIEADEIIDVREFILWRGMAAGSQAQGSWQNTKGDRAEIVIKGMLQLRFKEKGLILEEQHLEVNDELPVEEISEERFLRIDLVDGRKIVFGDEPDIAFFRNSRTIVAVEIKGGIDKAGVLERVGAAMKSLSRAKEENSEAVTILIVEGVSVSEQAIHDLKINRSSVNHWFTAEAILDDEIKREEFFTLLGI